MTDYKIDYQDSKKLWEFTMENCRIAEDYRSARITYANALKNLKLRLAREYGRGEVDRKMSEDKAYLVLADINEDCRTWLQEIIQMEGEFKGLEKVMEARAAAVSFNQSLIKNEARNTQ